jgi:hypothetical protein
LDDLCESRLVEQSWLWFVACGSFMFESNFRNLLVGIGSTSLYYIPLFLSLDWLDFLPVSSVEFGMVAWMLGWDG